MYIWIVSENEHILKTWLMFSVPYFDYYSVKVGTALRLKLNHAS